MTALTPQVRRWIFDRFDQFEDAGCRAPRFAELLEMCRLERPDLFPTTPPGPKLVHSAPSLAENASEKPRRRRKPKLRMINGGRT